MSTAFLAELAAAIVPPALVVSPQVSVQQAIAQLQPEMAQGAADADGCIWIAEEGRYRGLLISQDVIRLVAEGRSLEALTMAEVLIPVEPLTTADLSPPDRVAARLRQGWPYPLPVLGQGGEMVGLITAASLWGCVPQGALAGALGDAGDRFRDTFAQAAVGIAHVSLEGRFIRINQRFAEIVGYAPKVLMALTFADITHPDDLAVDLGNVQALLAGEAQTYCLEKRYLRPDGEAVWANLTVSLVRTDATGAPQYFIAVIEDISDRKCSEAERQAVEEALKRQRDFNRLIAQITTRFVDVSRADLAAEIDQTLGRLGSATGVDSCYLMTLSPLLTAAPSLAGGTMSMTHEWCRTGCESRLAEAQGIPWEAFPWSLARLQRRQSLQVPAVADLPPEAATDQANWRRFGVISLVAVPLVQAGQISGFLGFAVSGETLAPGEGLDGEMVALLQTVAQAIANAQRRIRAEQDLYISEERLRLALAAGNLGIYDLNLQTGEAVVNPEYARMLGYDPANFHETHARWLERLHPEDRAGVAERYQAYVAGESSEYDVEFRLRTRTGEYIWIRSMGRVVAWDGAGEPRRLLGMHTDITEQKRIEAERHQAAQARLELTLLEQILEVILVGYWDWDIPGNYEYFSPGFKRMFGYADGELPNTPESWQQLILPEDLPGVMDCFERHVQSRGAVPFYNEVRYRHRDGSILWVICSGKVIAWDGEGNPQRMIGCHIDITRRKQAEASTRQTKEELERFFLVALDLLCIANLDGHFRRLNQAWETTLGYPLEELEGLSFLELVHPEDVAPTLEAIAALRGQAVVQSFVNRYRCKDGSYCYIEWHSRTYGDLIYAAARDITERRQVEERLRKSDAHLKAAQRIGQLGSWEFDLETEKILWSDEVFRIFGLDPAAGPPSYEQLLQLYHPEDREYHERVVKTAIETGKPYDLSCRIHRPDGRLVYIQARGEPVFDGAGGLVQLIGTILDVTEQKQAEAQLLQTTAQLAASNRELEAFAYSVSHDLRSPLRAIDGFSQALLEDYGDLFNAEGQDYFSRIRRNVKRMGDLIDDLLNLSRVSRCEMRLQTVNLSELVEQQIHELRLGEPGRQVETVVAPDVVVAADLTLMHVAIGNLVQNAWKFTSHHPTARIEFGVMAASDPPVYFIRDDGAGFDMAYARMLFGVFQRLHNGDEFPGTGIGLATVQRVIHRHGGEVWAEGAVEAGATVYFTLAPGRSPVLLSTGR